MALSPLIVGAPGADQGRSPAGAKSKLFAAAKAQNSSGNASPIPEAAPDLAEQLNMAEKAKYIKGPASPPRHRVPQTAANPHQARNSEKEPTQTST